MGLTMREKRSLTRETARRYRQANKKGKQKILDEFTQNTEYHRKYAIRLLANWGKQKLRTVDGKPVRFIVGKPPRRKKRTGRRRYDEAVRAAVRKIWELFDYMCGKRLAVLIRMNLALLCSQPELGIKEAVRQKLLQISRHFSRTVEPTV